MTYRKFSPIDRIEPIFEFTVDGEAIFDVSYNDAGICEVAFHSAIVGVVMEEKKFRELIETGIILAESEKSRSY